MVFPAISNIINLIDDYKMAWLRYYLNDNTLIEPDLCVKSSLLMSQILDALTLLEKGASK